MWTSLKTFRSEDMALFAYHDDRRLGSIIWRVGRGASTLPGSPPPSHCRHAVPLLGTFSPKIERDVLINTYLGRFFDRFLFLQAIKACLSIEIERHCTRGGN